MFKLQESIENGLYGLEKICFAPMAADDAQREISQCVVQSLFGYFSNSFEEFEKISIDDSGYIVNYLDHLDKCLTWAYNCHCPHFRDNYKW